jgi:hypothetical protein
VGTIEEIRLQNCYQRTLGIYWLHILQIMAIIEHHTAGIKVSSLNRRVAGSASMLSARASRYEQNVSLVRVPGKLHIWSF